MMNAFDNSADAEITAADHGLIWDPALTEEDVDGNAVDAEFSAFWYQPAKGTDTTFLRVVAVDVVKAYNIGGVDSDATDVMASCGFDVLLEGAVALTATAALGTVLVALF